MDFLELVNKFLDPDNDELILLKDEDGKPVAFEQVAYVPYKSEGVEADYVLLVPSNPDEDEPDDEVYIFKIDYDERCIVFETDDDIADAVFNEYLSYMEDDE